MVLGFEEHYFYSADPYPAANFSFTKPIQVNWSSSDKSLRTDFPMSHRGGEDYFLFKYSHSLLNPPSYLTYILVLTSRSKLWLCNLYLDLFFLCSAIYKGATENKAGGVHFIFQKMRYGSPIWETEEHWTFQSSQHHRRLGVERELESSSSPMSLP